MVQVEKKIFVDREIFVNEYDYTFGDKKENIVCFYYYKPKNDNIGKAIERTYTKALQLARERARDGRYKNYEFLIKLY